MRREAGAEAGVVGAAAAGGGHLRVVVGRDADEEVVAEAAAGLLGRQVVLADVAAAGRRGADHAGLGPCFPSHTKALARRPEGAALVRACLPVASVPVFPIGGITAANVGDLVAAGASRVAVGAGILGADDPAAAARAIAAVLARTAGT